jgi:arsenate reductase
MAKTHDPITLYHNPRCSKSRAALALLRERGLEPQVVEYLQTPPTVAELKGLMKKLGLKPVEVVRKSEAEYKAYVNSKKDLSDTDWINAIALHPILLERPIVVRGDRAVIGRPTEAVLTLLD